MVTIVSRFALKLQRTRSHFSVILKEIVLVNAMTATISPPEERVQLSGISWTTYEASIDELSHRRLRLTYYRGALDIVVPSPERERYKEILGRFVETVAEFRAWVRQQRDSATQTLRDRV